MSKEALREAFVAGAREALQSHRECACSVEEAVGYVENWAHAVYPTQTRPRVVTIEDEGWLAEYRVVDGVIEARSPMVEELLEEPELGEWRRSQAYTLQGGFVFINPESAWSGHVEAIRELVANPTEEVDD